LVQCDAFAPLRLCAFALNCDACDVCDGRDVLATFAPSRFISLGAGSAAVLK
jgi:hypothetical protein